MTSNRSMNTFKWLIISQTLFQVYTSENLRSLHQHHQNDQLHSPDISGWHRPKSPNVTSQEGEEAEKFMHQIFGKDINESDYILPNTWNMNGNDSESNMEKWEDHDKDSVNLFSTIHPIPAPIGHSTKSPRQTITNTPELLQDTVTLSQ